MPNSPLIQLARQLLEASEEVMKASPLKAMPPLEASEAAQVIHELMESAGPSDADRRTRVIDVMERLEWLADSVPPFSLSLMTALQSIAGDLYMHDVYDAIGLWRDACDKSTEEHAA